MEIAIVDEGKTSQYIWYKFNDLSELQSWCERNVTNDNVLREVMKPIETLRSK